MRLPIPLAILNVVVALLFALFSWVQYNDTDPAIYDRPSVLDAWLWLSFYALIAVLLVVGLYGLFAKRHVVQKILGLVITEYAVNLFLVAVGYRDGGRPPILTPGEDPMAFAAGSVDPLPQALVLTSIVIGLGVIMLLVAIALRLHQRFGTLDTAKMNRLHG